MYLNDYILSKLSYTSNLKINIDNFFILIKEDSTDYFSFYFISNKDIYKI